MYLAHYADGPNALCMYVCRLLTRIKRRLHVIQLKVKS